MSIISRTLGLCFLLLASFVANASKETEQIAAYIGAPERVRYPTENAATQMASTNPQLADALRHSLAYMDAGEINTIAAGVFDHYLSKDDIQILLRFFVTPLGQRVSATFHMALDPQTFVKAIAAYPEKDQNDPIFKAPAMAHLVTAMNSPEWGQAWHDYGETPMCRYFQHENPTGYTKLRQQGHCVAQQATPADRPLAAPAAGG